MVLLREAVARQPEGKQLWEEVVVSVNADRARGIRKRSSFCCAACGDGMRPSAWHPQAKFFLPRCMWWWRETERVASASEVLSAALHVVMAWDRARGIRKRSSFCCAACGDGVRPSAWHPQAKFFLLRCMWWWRETERVASASEVLSAALHVVMAWDRARGIRKRSSFCCAACGDGVRPSAWHPQEKFFLLRCMWWWRETKRVASASEVLSAALHVVMAWDQARGIRKRSSFCCAACGDGVGPSAWHLQAKFFLLRCMWWWRETERVASASEVLSAALHVVMAWDQARGICKRSSFCCAACGDGVRPSAWHPQAKFFLLRCMWWWRETERVASASEVLSAALHVVMAWDRARGIRKRSSFCCAACGDGLRPSTWHPQAKFEAAQKRYWQISICIMWWAEGGLSYLRPTL